ncbi:hypothetical protein KKH23_07645 [Patescibacteria group bacterium]|nr:hypothetical protein [Patescibacteria group bacterium]
MSYKLHLDYDEHGWPELTPEELLDLVRMDARRFLEYPIMGGRIVLSRSDGGYHLKAPYARLTKEQQELATILSYAADSGYKWWTIHHGRATLRISDKRAVKKIGDKYVGRINLGSKPRLLEIIE